MNTESDVERLIAVLDDATAHYQAREDAAFRLGLSRDPRGLDPLLALVDFTDPDGEDEELEYFSVRFAVVGALGNLGDPGAVDALIRLLDDDDLDIVKEAAVALGHLGDERAIEPLRGVASRDDPNFAWAAAAHAIDVIRRAARRSEAWLAEWEPGADGKGILILKQGELGSELELWKTEGGKPTIYEGMEILESAGALRAVSAPMRIWPDGRFVMHSVPWAPSEPLAVWGEHVQLMDERLSFDAEQSLARRWDLSDEGLA